MSIYRKLTKSQMGKWGALRKRHFKSQSWCVACAKMGRAVAGQCVDHIVPHRGDERLLLDPSNLQTLCFTCHNSAKHKAEIRGYDHGLGADGLPADPMHPWNRQAPSISYCETEVDISYCETGEDALANSRKVGGP